MQPLPAGDGVVPYGPVGGDGEAGRERRRVVPRAEPHHDVARAVDERGGETHRTGPALADALGHEDVVVESQTGAAVAPFEELAVAERGRDAVARAGHGLETEERLPDGDQTRP